MITATFWTAVPTIVAMISFFGWVLWQWRRSDTGFRVRLAQIVFWVLAVAIFCWLLQGVILAVNSRVLGYIMCGVFGPGFVAIVLYFRASLHLVPEYEQHIAMVFKRYWDTWGSGIHFGPHGLVKTPEELQVTTMDITTDIYPSGMSVEVENALVGIKATLTMRIEDARAFLFTVHGGGDVILDGQVPRVVRDAIQTILGAKPLKEMRTTLGSALKDEVEPLVEDRFERWGLKIVSLVIDDLREPPEVQRARIERYAMQMLDEAARDLARRALGITKPDDQLSADQLNQIQAALPNAREDVARLQALNALSGANLVIRGDEVMRMAGLGEPVAAPTH